MTEHVYHVTGINPEPWTASKASRGKTSINFYKDEKLKSYQAGLAEELPLQNGHIFCYPPTVSLRVTFYLWRQLEGDDEKKQRANWADATNLQKATEDACQGILFVNDKLNRDVRTVVVQQAPNIDPHILVVIEEWKLAKELSKYPRPTYGDYSRTNVDYATDLPDLF